MDNNAARPEFAPPGAKATQKNAPRDTGEASFDWVSNIYPVLWFGVVLTLQALWHTSVGHTILTGGLYLLGIGCCLIQVVGLIELMTRLRIK